MQSLLENLAILTYHAIDLSKGARKEMCVLDENEHRKARPRLQSVRCVGDDFRLILAKKAEEEWKTVVRLRIQDDRQEEEAVVKDAQ